MTSNQAPDYVTYNGTSSADSINTYDLVDIYNYKYGFEVNGGDGDDTLLSFIYGDSRIDQLKGDEGNDYLVGSAFLSDYAAIIAVGGIGRDFYYFCHN